MERTSEDLWNIKCCDKCNKANIEYYDGYYGYLRCPYQNEIYNIVFLQKHHCDKFEK